MIVESLYLRIREVEEEEDIMGSQSRCLGNTSTEVAEVVEEEDSTTFISANYFWIISRIVPTTFMKKS